MPLDVLLLVDASSSMSEPIEGVSKWNRVRDSLLAFMKDPGSAGLGIGLQYLPLPGPGTPCNGEADCGYPFGGLSPPACAPTKVCAGPGADPTMGLRQCEGRYPAKCPTGQTCVAAGRCKVSHMDCTNVGQACPGGAGDVCTALGLTCQEADEADCKAVTYENLSVP